MKHVIDERRCYVWPFLMPVWFQKSLLIWSVLGGSRVLNQNVTKTCTGGGDQRLRNFVPKKKTYFWPLPLAVQFSTTYFWKNSMSIIHRQDERRFKVLIRCVRAYAWYEETCTSKRRHFPTNIHSMFGANFSWEIAISSPVLKLLNYFFNFRHIGFLWCFLKVLASCYPTLADRAEIHCLPTQACSTQSTVRSFLETWNGTAAGPYFCTVEIRAVESDFKKSNKSRMPKSF